MSTSLTIKNAKMEEGYENLGALAVTQRVRPSFV